MAHDSSDYNSPPNPPKSFGKALMTGLKWGLVIGLGAAALLFFPHIAIAVAGVKIAGLHILGTTAAHTAATAAVHAGAAHSIAAHAFWPVVGIATGTGTVLSGIGNLISKAVYHHKEAKQQKLAMMADQPSQQQAIESPALSRTQAPSYPEPSTPQRNWRQMVSSQPDMGIDNSQGRSV